MSENQSQPIGNIKLEPGKFLVPADRGWRAVITNANGELFSYPVVFWRITVRVYTELEIDALVCPFRSDGNIVIAKEIEDYLGVIGPDESVEDLHDLAVDHARTAHGTSPLTMLGGTAE